MTITRRQIFENLTLACAMGWTALAGLKKATLIDKHSRKSVLKPESVPSLAN